MSLNPKEDGNCLFSSISDQMKLCLCKNISPATIRSDIVQYLWNRRDSLTLLDGTTVHLSEKVSYGDVESYLHEMAQPGTFGDHIMILGACCLYLVQFTILSSLGDNATAVVAPNESSTIMPDLPMLLLGHIAEGKGDHYVSLVGGTIGTPPLEQEASATQPIPLAQAASNMRQSPKSNADCQPSSERLDIADIVKQCDIIADDKKYSLPSMQDC